MRKISVIGVGAGHPDHLTLQAVNALRSVDAVFAIDKGDDKASLRRMRDDICSRHLKATHRIVEATEPPRDRAPPDYGAAVRDWHDARAAIYERMIRDGIAEDEHGAFLVWGDPSLYDSTLRILDQVIANGGVAFSLDVIPGITSVQALAAAHCTPLHRIGGPIHITTGRRLGETLPADDVVVMLDGRTAFNAINEPDVEILWGAYVGTPDQLLVSGSLHDCAAEIERQRAEARAQHGWIMDTYILRRRTPAAGRRLDRRRQ